jgi:hypothetical protein
MSSHSVKAEFVVYSLDDFMCSVTWLPKAMLAIGNQGIF